MQEAFLHYLWQFQYFDRRNLVSSAGEGIEVMRPGLLNTHQGPDFANAKIKIGGMEWAGSVEIHIRSSEWFEHGHHHDPAYEQVVLHVVWQMDRPVYRADNTMLPTLELVARVDDTLIKEYQKLVNNPAAIPCKRSFPQVDEITKLSMLDRAMIQRLESKGGRIHELLRSNNNHWQETAYQILAGNFGFKINSDPFLALAKALPYRILMKHSDQPIQVEALLFGQAGFLDIAIGDDYYQTLRREYTVLERKYALSKRKLSRVQWRFLRMRPANFPTVRIAQFAAVITQHRDFFSTMLELCDIQGLRKLFAVSQSEYWQTHYQFNREARAPVAALGDSSVDNILINSVSPLLAAYAQYKDEQEFLDRAIHLLQTVPAEHNAIMTIWEALGYKVKTAFDSQALIELYNHFCQQRNCLNCAIGAAILKPKL